MKDERIKVSHYRSAGIRAFARMVGARYMVPVAEYGHGDARVAFFRLEPGGHLAADTNGDPLLGEEAEAELERLRREDEWEPLWVETKEEADWLNANALHCGHVEPGDDWDTAEAWPDLEDRAMAREILLRYRREGASATVTDGERWRLAVCCR